MQVALYAVLYDKYIVCLSLDKVHESIMLTSLTLYNTARYNM